MSQNYVESVARTNRLYCSDCDSRIRKGESVVFLLDDCEDKPMRSVYCHRCKGSYEMEVASERHPFDLDG